MTNPRLVPGSSYDDEDDDQELVCDCGHHFTRGQLDIKKVVKIYELEEDLDTFDVDEHVVIRSECPTCSCCSIEDDSISVDESEDQWMCSECLTIHDDENGADQCCEEA